MKNIAHARIMSSLVELDAPVGDDGEKTFGEYKEDTIVARPEQAAEAHLLSEDLIRILNDNLSPARQKLLCCAMDF
jgi:DNA-directed RNA polymerase sigma subunit (sigma70/sigma32)